MGTVNVGASPSYVELQICLEMMQDSRKHQQEERARSRNPASPERGLWGTLSLILLLNLYPSV